MLKEFKKNERKNFHFFKFGELGDQVMVGFLHNHSDRPFVMGGMFHGGTALGGSADNRVKSIMTRSGHKVIFTEDESIIITDKSGNEIHLDTTGSNINITAPETINIKCKNFNIDVDENMNTNVGMNIFANAGMNFTEISGINYVNTAGGMMMQNAVLDYSLMASNIMNVASENFSYPIFNSDVEVLKVILLKNPRFIAGNELQYFYKITNLDSEVEEKK